MSFDRFMTAQAPLRAQVEAELGAGQKRTHWMWFVFPQIAGLGHSAMAQRYAIQDMAEEQAYLAHPSLGTWLLHCTGLVLAVPDRTAHAIFGSPDDLKFRSCLTLFAAAAPGPGVFAAGLDRFFDSPDPATLRLL